MPSEETKLEKLSKKEEKEKQIQEEKEKQKELDIIKSRLSDEIISLLGMKKSDFARVDVVPIWDNRFRVNLWTRNGDSMRIEYSYFISITEDGFDSNTEIKRKEEKNGK